MVAPRLNSQIPLRIPCYISVPRGLDVVNGWHYRVYRYRVHRSQLLTIDFTLGVNRVRLYKSPSFRIASARVG